MIVRTVIFSRVVTYNMNIITQAFRLRRPFRRSRARLHLHRQHRHRRFQLCLLLGMASALETICGQIFGVKQYHMLGVYMKCSWIVLFVWGVLLLPTTSILELTGHSMEISAHAGMVSIYFIHVHFSFVFLFPLTRFLQCQLKNSVVAVVSMAVLVVHIFVTWLFILKLKFEIIGITITLDFSRWVTVFGLYGYVCCGGCPLTWKVFSMKAFVGLWEVVNLSTVSSVMLCLENWYYIILLILDGNVKNLEVTVDALSICMGINSCLDVVLCSQCGVLIASRSGIFLGL